MKPNIKPLATALAATLQLTAIAAVPLAWDVRPGQPAPVMFDRYHGEMLSFSASFVSSSISSTKSLAFVPLKTGSSRVSRRALYNVIPS